MDILKTLKSANPINMLKDARFTDLQKKMLVMAANATRPFSGSNSAGDIHVVPLYPWPLTTLYDLAYNSDVITTVHNALRRELFRNGYDLTVADEAGAETTSSEQSVEATDDEDKQKAALDFLESINENQQNVIDVCMEIEDDFNIMDEGYMVFLYEYGFNNAGKIIDQRLAELMRGDPRTMGKVMNRYDRPGHDDDNVEQLACPEHRDTLIPNKDPAATVRCQCGKECHRVYYYQSDHGNKQYYFRWEVVHRNKYRPSKRQGHPPMLTIWQKTRTLKGMDEYMMELYVGKRPPKSVFVVKTANQDSLSAAWKEMIATAKDQPHVPGMLAVQSHPNDSSRQFAEFFNFMPSADEMQYVDVRNEMRRQIGAVYGVLPMWQADVSQSGGLNNEGMQVTVTNRAVEFGQEIYNKFYFPRIMEAMGYPGWVLKLNPSEEQDETAELDRQTKALEAGKLAVELGLEAEWNEDTGKVVIKEGTLEKPAGFGSGGLPFGNTDDGSDPGDSASGAPEDPGISKSVKKKRPAFSDLSKVLKDQIDKFFKKYKRKPSEADLKKALAKIDLNLQRELKDAAERKFKKIYQEAMIDVEKDVGMNFSFDDIDKNALVALRNQDVLAKAYAGISNNITGKINDVIREAYHTPNGMDLRKITEKIAEAAGVADTKAEAIARTETSKVSSAARRINYRKADPDNEFIYKWIGPNDFRTTKLSKRIKNRVGNGVTWDMLVKIIDEESSKDFPEWRVDKEFPVSHYQSRHTFVRVVNP